VGPDTCYYDGDCGMCRGTVRRLRRLDWLGHLRFIDMLSVPESQLPVKLAQAMQGMPMRTADGRVLVGFPAVRRALSRTPLGAPLAWILYLPGLRSLGAPVYNFIARNRRRDSACSIRPQPRNPASDPAPASARSLLR
jgi:predicted DCC family thiol-disulfide oxidoreductase YuxK